MRPSMLDRSAITSFLPSSATRQPRTADVHSSMTFGNSRSSTSAFMATMPASMSSCFIVGRGRFCSCTPRPASRPVRDAPQNWIVPRSRPSLDVDFRKLRYLAGLVADAWARISSRARTSGGRSSRSSSLSTVPPRRFSISRPMSRRSCKVLSRWVALATAPPVSAAMSSASRADALCAARRAAVARSRSTATPRSLIA